MKSCPKCGVEFDPYSIHGEKKFCSRKCANSRGPRSDEFKKSVSKKLKGRKVNKESIEKRVETRWSKLDKEGYTFGYEIRNCVLCDSPFKTTITRNRKICFNEVCKTNYLAFFNSIRGKKSAAKRTKRSKEEIKLFELCKKLDKDVKNNIVISDGWDADIVFEDRKIAILWNGPWHYQEMPHKNHSLKQVQNRDKIKADLFQKLGWKVIVFEDRYYSPETAFEEIKKVW